MVQRRTPRKAATLSLEKEAPIVSPHAENSTIYNLYLLGRIPFCLEATLWCLLGTVLYHAKYHTLSVPTTILSTGLVFLTNVSINYANEYFDFEADSILASKADVHGSHGGSKMLINGTFQRGVALACAGVVQAFILLAIAGSRFLEGNSSSLQGLVLQFGLLAMFAAQQYVGPPLRLHYNGGGELISSMEIAAGPVAYGFLSQVTAARQRGLSLREGWECLGPQMRVFLLWAFAFELGRIFMMHAADITEDRAARKHTLVSIVGFAKAQRLYQVATLIQLFIAWNLLVMQKRAAWLMLPMLAYSIPIALNVQSALTALVADPEKDGRKVFSHVPALVSIQTLATPAVFIGITLLVGNCLD